MKPTLLATVLLLALLAVASLGCALISPLDTAAWTISELSTILAVVFTHFYLSEYPDR